MKKRIRKIIGRLLITLVALVSLNFLVYFFIGDINYSQTFGTQYERTENERITRTSWIELRTTTKLVNIEMKPDCPGIYGIFLTPKGQLDYEYGMFGPSFEPDNYEYEYYQIQEVTVNGYFIRTAKKEDEFGLYIPAQKTMQWSLSIYPSTTAYELRDELVKAATTAKYEAK